MTVESDYVDLGFRLTTITFSSRFNIQFTEHFRNTMTNTPIQKDVKDYDAFMTDSLYGNHNENCNENCDENREEIEEKDAEESDDERVPFQYGSTYTPRKIILKKGVRKFRFSQAFPLFRIERK